MLHYVMFIDNAQTSCVRIMGVGTMPLGIIFIFSYMCTWICVHVSAGTHGVQKRALDLLGWLSAVGCGCWELNLGLPKS